MDYRFTIALIYDFDGTLAPGLLFTEPNVHRIQAKECNKISHTFHTALPTGKHRNTYYLK